MKPIITEKEYWGLFEIGIIIKGLNAIGDVVAGLILWFTSKVFLVTFLLNFFQNDLSDNPNDYVAKFIVDSAATLAVSSQYFLGAYLFIHGIIKIFLLIFLYKKKIWAYPISIVVFSLIMFYEFNSFYLGQSIWVLAFALFDLFLVLLIVHEYKVLRKKQIKI